MRAVFALALPAVVALAACGTKSATPAHAKELDATDVAALIPDRVRDAPAWATAIVEALRETGVPRERQSACAVVAIIGQESGFREDPEVPSLGKLVQARLRAYGDRFRGLGRPVLDRLLAGHAPGDPRAFDVRLAHARTERDVDRAFRDVLAYQRASHRAAYELVNAAAQIVEDRSLSDLNPITTAGPMQVSVAFAHAWARTHERHRQLDEAQLREALYTKTGGVLFGTARLYAHAAAYDDVVYRFADYNAGLYASRNAAVQAQLARLTGEALATDGDLLIYDKAQEPMGDESRTMKTLRRFRDRYAPELSDRRLRQDAEQEKTEAFEHTETYAAIKRTYAARFGPPVYATVPDVTLTSPKLSGKRTTAWFARAVKRRHDACLATLVAAALAL